MKAKYYTGIESSCYVSETSTAEQLATRGAARLVNSKGPPDLPEGGAGGESAATRHAMSRLGGGRDRGTGGPAMFACRKTILLQLQD